jgi:predicted O-methyltransferase YrrM
VFETWLETCLLPTLEVGQVVVMDNATFHTRWAPRGKKEHKLCATMSAGLRYKGVDLANTKSAVPEILV